jgi:phage-related protein
MIMADLHLPDYTPVSPITKAVKPRQRKAKLPDWGTEQRATVGQNQTSPEWDVRWVLNPSQANTLDAFLAERAKQGEWFLWRPPGGTQGRFRCEEWTKTLTYCSIREVQASFRQVYSYNLPSIGVGAGYFVLSGTTAAFRYNRVLTISSLWDDNLALIDTWTDIDGSSFALTGNPATLTKGYPILTTVGTFVLTGAGVAIQRLYRMQPTSGALVLSGKPVRLFAPGFAISQANFVLTSTPIGTTLEEYPLSTATASASLQALISVPTFTLSATPSGTTLAAVGLNTINGSATLQLLVTPVDFL